jgi:hypothetical protein
VTADAVRIVSGGSVSQAPEIDVAGFEHSIVAGDTSPTLLDGTDFGGILATTDSPIHTFTIRNTGNGVLNLSGSPGAQLSGPNPGDFVVVTQPAATVAPGETTTFDVMFHPTTTGQRQAVVSITSNDANEGLYQFAVEGVGTDGPIGVPLAQNFTLPVDVNADSLVTPRDALIVINELLQQSVDNASAAPLAAPAAATSAIAAYYPDVDGNGMVSPRDALMVINYLLDPPVPSSVTPAAVAAPSALPAVQVFVVDEAISQVTQPAAAVTSGPIAVTDSQSAAGSPRETSATLLTPSSVEALFAASDETESEDELELELEWQFD